VVEARTGGLGARTASARDSASSSKAVAAGGSVCAPPVGSRTISSMRPASRRSGAVSFRASAASTFFAASRHRIAAQPSGGMTL
jgi:hypothetical protein